MTEYKGIKGGKVQNFDTDPDNPYVGQVWYNQTLGDLRVRATTLTSAWATGGNLNTAKYLMGAAGTTTASIVAGGDPAPNLALAESYNGTSWTEVNDLNTGRYWLAGSGTSTAGLFVGGDSPTKANVETWNGTSWTEDSDMSTARGKLAGAGTQPSSLAFGGESPGTPFMANTEEFTKPSFTVKTITSS